MYQDDRNDLVPSKAVFAFFALTFVMTWGIIGAYIFFPHGVSAALGDLRVGHPAYFLATWAPAIAGIAIVVTFGGLHGLQRFFSRLLLWRCAPVWRLFILVGIPLVFMAGSLIKGGPILAPLPDDGAGPFITLTLLMLLLGPVEEFGWRGVAQPLLQRHMAPIWAGAFIGSAWGIWHLPAFYLSGVVFSEWSFLPFLIGNITLAILVTPIFNSARGSILLPMLFHWQLIIPFWPDAQPWDTVILVVTTAVVVWWRRDTMFSRSGAVTSVLSVRLQDARIHAS